MRSSTRLARHLMLRMDGLFTLREKSSAEWVLERVRKLGDLLTSTKTTL